MREILSLASVQVTESEAIAALDQVQKTKTRFNVGETGRGKLLSDVAKDSLSRLLEHYPNFQDDPLFIKTRRIIAASADG